MSEQFKRNQKEARKLWVEALRSGRYMQGRNALETDDGRYCCLGVACQLFDATERHIRTVRDDTVYFDDSHGSLPEIVMQWLGIRDEEGIADNLCLVTLNDSEEKTFAEIADIIESEPEGLFVHEGESV